MPQTPTAGRPHPFMPLGAPISILGPTPSGHSHGEQYREYRRACHRLASMAKSLQETAGVLGALGSPVRLTCGIALSLSQALEGVIVKRQTCSEIADLVTRHLNTIRNELDEAAKGDDKFRSLVEDYAETLREVSQGVALIAHRRRLSQLVHHRSESEELLRFKDKLDAAFEAMMLQCGLRTRQIQGHVVTDPHEQSLNEKLECVLEKPDYTAGNRSNLERPAIYFDDSSALSTNSPTSDPIDHPEPTSNPAFSTAHQRRIVENQHEQSHNLAALNEKLESVLTKLDHIVENRSNLDQTLQMFARCFDDSNVMSTHPPTSDPIDLLEPTGPMPIPTFATV